MEQPTLAVILNPHTLAGVRADLARLALERLRARARVELLETRGDGGDGERIADLLARATPAAVVAGGGDGTVGDVAAALLRLSDAPRPPLALLPLGTANNVARSLGLLALRQRGAVGVERAVAAILDGRPVPLDLGVVGGRCFVGSFAVGMDAAILAARNRWRRRFALGAVLGGYPLYLLSCAANLARQRAAAASLRIDGVACARPLYNLLVTNVALYAGEFRFDAGDHSADAQLDLHLAERPDAYVRAFVAAWRRHLRAERGATVTPPPDLRRCRRIEIELDAPLACQLDGEEGGAAAAYDVSVLPHALHVLRPA